MVNRIYPESLIASLIESTREQERIEITFRKLRNIRSFIENEDDSLYVDVTYNSIKNMINANPGIMEFHETKIIIHMQSTVDNIRMLEFYRNMPYRNLIDKSFIEDDE